MDRNVQNAIIKNPVPILIGNTSFQPSAQYDYFYTTSYVVDEPVNTYASPGHNYYIAVFYDYFDDNWRLYINGTQTPNYFPELSGVRSGDIFYYNMNGYVNNTGFPSFSRSGSLLGPASICYNNSLNTWASTNVKPVDKLLYTYSSIDIADDRFGYSYNGGQVITSFIQDEPIMPSITTPVYILYEGNISQKNSILKFKNADDEVISAKVIPNRNSIGRSSSRSPNIISGEPCLGYYFNNENDNNEQPYVIGSICIGTTDLTTVPPIVGQNTLTSFDGIHNRDQFDGKLKNGTFYLNAFTWLGTTIDKTKDEWNLYQITANSSTPYNYGNFILIKGNHNMVNPSNAKQFWYMSGGSINNGLFRYDVLKNGITFRAWPSGSSSNITLNIVGLTSFNADEVKHVGTQSLPNFPIYIGNWISPQVKWRTENA